MFLLISRGVDMFYMISVAVVIILFSIVANHLVKRMKDYYRDVIIFVLGIFIAFPGSIARI